MVLRRVELRVEAHPNADVLVDYVDLVPLLPQARPPTLTASSVAPSDGAAQGRTAHTRSRLNTRSGSARITSMIGRHTRRT